MTYYKDLSPYEYTSGSVPDGVTALNIGWLEEGHEHLKGSVPDDFTQGLARLVSSARQMKMRGWHRCRISHDSDREQYPITVEVSGKEISLGAAEIRVVSSSGEWLIAPDLIFHYVIDHSYRPPTEFIEAVVKQRVAPPYSAL
ncbi:hypothetical protein GCM10010252_75100 [Streptomyces aureoverticillatus]|nr:hypothetical protein GCM10010252_75100 [Streptomyces aureoverticillatus]